MMPRDRAAQATWLRNGSIRQELSLSSVAVWRLCRTPPVEIAPARGWDKVCVIYFRIQTSSSHTISHPQSHVGTPIKGNSTPHRRHPLVMT